MADKNEDTQLQRVEIRDPERTSLWTGLAVGLGLAALVGVVIALIVRRREENGVVGNHAWNPQAMTPIPGYDNLGAQGVPPHVPFASPNSSSSALPLVPGPLPLRVPPRL